MDPTLRPMTRPNDESGPATGHGHGGHGWMMLLCVPMVLIAVVLLTTGVITARGLIYLVPCLAMMAGMMFFMSPARGARHKR